MSDFRDLLGELVAHDVRFMVVGAHALGAHGYVRGTNDLDVWIERSPANADRTWRALASFGAPLESLGITEVDFESVGRVVQFGIPPGRIDVLMDVSGLNFSEAWSSRIEGEFEGVTVSFLGRADLIRNKLSSGRPKDLLDVESLGEVPGDR